jgi:hypothetical protein
MFNRKFDDEGDNSVDNPNIYNVEGDNPWQPGIILLSSTKQNIQALNILG